MEICQFVPKYLDILGFLLFFFRFRLYKISNLNFVTKGLLLVTKTENGDELEEKEKG